MDTMTAVSQFGVPIVALVSIGIALRQAATWLGTKVVEPLATKHMEFLDSTTATMKQQADAAQQTAKTLEALQEQQANSAEHILEIRTNTSRLACLVKPHQ